MTKMLKDIYIASIVNESPMMQDAPYMRNMDDFDTNASETAKYLANNNVKLIDKFNFTGIKLLIYEYSHIEKTQTVVEYALIIENRKLTLGRVFLIMEVINKTEYYFTHGLWNYKDVGKGLIFNFFTKWLLPKYKLIISDNLTTKLGKNFWLKIAKYGLANNKECGIYTDPAILKDESKCFKWLFKYDDFLKGWDMPKMAQRIYIKE